MMNRDMEEAGRTPDDAGRAFRSWFGFWIQFLILGALAVIGAFVASADAWPGDYLCGLLLSLGAVALAFLRLRQRLDGKAFVARLATSRFVADPVLLKEVELVLSETKFNVILFNNGMHGWQHTEAEMPAASARRRIIR